MRVEFILNACSMHALHTWTRVISASMFISVPLLALQSNQKHTDQCVSNGMWRGQVSKKTNRTTCKSVCISVCISTSAFMLYVVVARVRVSFCSSVHVDWQVQWSIRFCTGGWRRWHKHPKFEWKMYSLTGCYGQGRLPTQYPKNLDQHIQFTTSLHELRWEPVQHYCNPFFI